MQKYDVPLSATLLFALASGALYWRRQQPQAVLAVNLAVMALLTGLGYLNSVWALPFALYGVGRYADSNRWNYLGVGTAIILVVIASLFEGEAAGFFSVWSG